MKKEKLKKVGKQKSYGDGGCVCNKCGHSWNPFKTEHFNFTCCPVCYSSNVKQG